MSDINEKIKKLLRLASSDNENESRLAMARARKLMAQYKLDIKDFDESTKEVIELKTDMYFTPYKNAYRNTLIQLIAEKYCCVSYSTRYNNSSKRYITLRGYEEDVRVLHDVLKFADSCVEKWFKKAKKEKYHQYTSESQNAIKNAYGIGFAKGLSELLDEQMNSAEEQEWGLVMVVPQEAKDYQNSLRHSRFATNVSDNEKVKGKGYYDGLHANINKSLTE